MSDTESDSSGLRIHLNQCEAASNSSAAMTPRIIKEKERKSYMSAEKINGEIDFTSSITMKPAKLSPDQYDRIREITELRRKEHLEQSESHMNAQSRVSNFEYCINVETPVKMSHYQTHNDDSPAYFESAMLDSDRQYRQQQIIERLENLL
jgi:hypothetical protein